MPDSLSQSSYDAASPFWWSLVEKYADKVAASATEGRPSARRAAAASASSAPMSSSSLHEPLFVYEGERTGQHRQDNNDVLSEVSWPPPVKRRGGMASDPDKFRARTVESESGCWEWQGRFLNNGYGQCDNTTAHRVAYRLFTGEIPDGYEIDHLCRNKRCVNPEHLEAVTHAVNMSRGERANQTHCKRGHPFDEANTLIREMSDGYPRRTCRECARITARERNRRKYWRDKAKQESGAPASTSAPTATASVAGSQA